MKWIFHFEINIYLILLLCCCRSHSVFALLDRHAVDGGVSGGFLNFTISTHTHTHHTRRNTCIQKYIWTYTHGSRSRKHQRDEGKRASIKRTKPYAKTVEEYGSLAIRANLILRLKIHVPLTGTHVSSLPHQFSRVTRRLCSYSNIWAYASKILPFSASLFLSLSLSPSPSSPPLSCPSLSCSSLSCSAPSCSLSLPFSLFCSLLLCVWYRK